MTVYAVSTNDAVIVVPGLLGSELWDARTGDLVWGLRPTALAKALITGTVYERLGSEDLVPGETLRYAGFLPGLGRLEPYSSLNTAMRDFVRSPEAFAVFPYDWRRSIASVAADLAEFAYNHLRRWRAHPLGSTGAQLVLVGHSMGGLVAQHAANCLLPREDTRLLLTLGTPFLGSVKAVRALGTGDLLPFAHLAQNLRVALGGMASVHALLPSYPCLVDGDGTIRPSDQQLIACGADAALLAEATTSRATASAHVANHGEVPTVALVGSTQPTLQSFEVTEAGLDFREHVGGTNWGGDGTVYFGSAFPKDTTPFSLPQRHGALAKSVEAIEWIKHTIAAVTLGPPQGLGVGLDVPDFAFAGEVFQVRVSAPGVGGATCRIDSATGGPSPGSVRMRRVGEELIGESTVSHPGLYSVTARGGGSSPITEDLLVMPRRPG